MILLRNHDFADISTTQGFEPHPRFGHRTRIYLHMWVVRDSLSNLQTIPFDPICGYIRSWLISNIRDCQGQIKQMVNELWILGGMGRNDCL